MTVATVLLAFAAASFLAAYLGAEHDLKQCRRAYRHLDRLCGQTLDALEAANHALRMAELTRDDGELVERVCSYVLPALTADEALRDWTDAA